MLGDGAKGIWGIAEEHFPGATEIVDLYPGREHLAKVAKLRFGVRAVQSPEWLSARRDELDDGKVEAVIAAMSQPPVPDNGPQEEVQKEREYFRGNAERYALCRISQPGLIRGVGRGGGWLQDHLRPAPQAVRHALDGQGCQCHHRAALLPTQWSLGRILGELCGQPVGCLPTNLSHTHLRLSP